MPPSVSAVGVNLAGYLDATLGVGEAARQVRGALRGARGTPVAAAAGRRAEARPAAARAARRARTR